VSVTADPRLGTELTGYRIETLLGRGGMSVVYRAFDPRLKRNVALKLLSPELAQDERFRERFVRESELAASLEHPNVVPIHDVGEAEGQLFIVMRVVEGKDLKALLHDEEALEPKRALALCSQVADALDAAHARGLVHRDVKPSNVLLDEREHVYLADFGLSRRIADREAFASGARSLGTIDYVAPEQIRGKELDGRADTYSLGCLLHECLTGEPPFRRPSDAAVLFAHLEEEPPAPPGLEEVMPKALAKEPEDRYQSCRELVEAARVALGIAEPARSRWLRLPVVVSLAGLVLIAAALAAFFAVRGDGTSAPPPSGGSLVRIDPHRNKAAATIPVGKDPSAVAVGGGSVWVANFGDGTVSRVDPATNSIRQTIAAHGSPTGLAVAGSAVFAANGADGSVVVIDAGSGTISRTVALGGFPTYPATVDVGDGAVWIANSNDASVLRLDAVSGERVARIPLVNLPDEVHSGAVFTSIAAGEGAVWVAAGQLRRTVSRLDPATNRLIATIKLHDAPQGVAVGAGAVWVTNQLGDSVSRIDPRTNRVVETIPVGRGPVGIAVGLGAVWVANSLDGTVSRIDPGSNEVVDTTKIGGAPESVTVGPGAVWVTAHAQ
jgi:YVTN family beta-propeller protein